MIESVYAGRSCVRFFDWQRSANRLDNQHGVAKAEKAIARLLGLFVGVEEDAASSIGVMGMSLGNEGTDEQKQSGTGQVKIGKQEINGTEAIAGANE